MLCYGSVVMELELLLLYIAWLETWNWYLIRIIRGQGILILENI